MEQQFNDLNLIRKAAWSFHSTTGIDFEELMGEASLAYCKALKTYNPARGKLTTHVWQYMRDELINFARKEQKYVKNDEVVFQTYNTPHSSQFLFEILSKEAQEVAKVILRAPKKFLELPREKKPSAPGKPPRSDAERRVIQLLLQQGVPYHKILIGLKDLQLALTN
jgi:DNA-directed RNA polymerase specialized sigma subunit